MCRVQILGRKVRISFGATWSVQCAYLLFCKSSFVEPFFFIARDTLERIDVTKSLVEKYPQVSIL
jgi:hypothetical protein